MNILVFIFEVYYGIIIYFSYVIHGEYDRGFS